MSGDRLEQPTKVPFRNRPIVMTEESIARFWSKVNKTENQDECWEWNAGLAKDGYGIFAINRCPMIAHRVAWVITHGIQVPADTPFICHECDNKKCCNPKHLFAGTPKDNNQDCNKKGRRNIPKGDNHPSRKFPETAKWRGGDNPSLKTPELMPRGEDRWNAKLTAAAVIDIRARLAMGESRNDIAKAYLVTRGTIRNIANGKCWRHVT